MRTGNAPVVMGVLSRAALNRLRTLQRNLETDVSIDLLRDRIGRQHSGRRPALNPTLRLPCVRGTGGEAAQGGSFLLTRAVGDHPQGDHGQHKGWWRIQTGRCPPGQNPGHQARVEGPDHGIVPGGGERGHGWRGMIFNTNADSYSVKNQSSIPTQCFGCCNKDLRCKISRELTMTRSIQEKHSMKLTKFRVSNFRSVEDSDWIETDDITALVGVNESGKTNLLLPLWKLNPAQDGDIEPTSDYPKFMFGVIRDDPGNFCFIEAEFETVEAAAEIAHAAKIPQEIAKTVHVKRFFDGTYQIRFPKYTTVRTETSEWIARQLGQCIKSVETAAPLAAEKKSKLQASLNDRLSRIVEELPSGDTIDLIQLEEILNVVAKLVPAKPLKTSKLVPPVKKLARQLKIRIKEAKGPEPGDEEDVVNTVVEALPRFVYYSNYGNLDSEIYLPHVVENLSRDDLGTKESAKVRTLHVMFNFVRLKPDEILELGKDFQDVHYQNRQLTPEEIEEIEKITEQKKHDRFYFNLLVLN